MALSEPICFTERDEAQLPESAKCRTAPRNSECQLRLFNDLQLASTLHCLPDAALGDWEDGAKD